MPKQTEKVATQQVLFAIDANLANRNQIRESKKHINVTRLYRTELSMIRIRPDRFNARVKPEGMSEEAWNLILMIPELADKIHANNGPTEPILGDFHVDGYFYVTNGERRTRALNHLIATKRKLYPNGEHVSDVEVLMNAPGTTDLQRKLKMYSANDSLPLSPMQKAHYFLSFKNEPYNMSHDEIAALHKPMSRQSVDNYIMAAAELPQAVQDAIDTGEVKMTNALAEHRKEKAERKGKGKKAVEGDEEPIITGKLEEDIKSEAKEKEKIRGDEDEFDQQDNSVTGTSSRQLPEDRSSGSIAIGKDSIYMQQQRKTCMKQLINRYHHLQDQARQLIVADKPGDEEDEERGAILYAKREDHVIDRLLNEYDITVK